MYSYFESRGEKFPSTVFGLQYNLKRWMVGQVLTRERIEEARDFYRMHLGSEFFNERGWLRILEAKHEGRIPLRIKAVPEGTVVPTRNVLFTVENTDPMVPWLTNFFETILVQVWYPMTVATNSRYQKEILAKYLLEIGESLQGLHFKLHDFGFRGVSSVESAAIGGAAHLVNLKASDTVAALTMARNHYHRPMAGFSQPAKEHGFFSPVRILRIKKFSFKRPLVFLLKHDDDMGSREGTRSMSIHDEEFPKGIVCVVCDSHGVWNVCEKIWGRELKDSIVEREKWRQS
ncbi:unnamed protein product [Darwinula stevensoni]|uniref:Nicotinamide phosphoribosyltransferase n=1 Tax=Darwinula stevensoni TaxID=69355 RepID=A0A7R8X130_9CRUS|nr:unnamed protein product [Darwinula stevensoni]CAG0879525.1 unnamed protein product [Darwinula stevensoni]